LACGECGGKGCSKNKPDGLTGDDCCVSDILEHQQQRCSAPGATAPCVIEGPTRKEVTTTPTPKKPVTGGRRCGIDGPPGIVGGNDDGSVCCPLACGECGGKGCSKNKPDGLTGDDCCVSGILEHQQRCSDPGATAPCIIDDETKPTPEPRPTSGDETCGMYTHIAGIVGMSSKGIVCCPLGCGKCGGRNCSKNKPDGLTGDDCCISGVLDHQPHCSEPGCTAPCIIDGPTATKATPKPKSKQEFTGI
ncbi:unnamed protein product, partial [Ectocarpus sp. 12 AP-2014]